MVGGRVGEGVGQGGRVGEWGWRGVLVLVRRTTCVPAHLLLILCLGRYACIWVTHAVQVLPRRRVRPAASLGRAHGHGRRGGDDVACGARGRLALRPPALPGAG